MKVLIAEDSRYYQTLLQDTLTGWGYQVVLTSNGVQACEKLKEENGPKLAIIDWMMPHMTGLEVCKKVRSVINKGYIYLILLTANSSKEDVVRGLEAGADDYMIKPFDEMELKFRLKTGERIINLENRIMQLALTDSLTGLLNRRAFIDRLECEIERHKRLSQPLSLIMADIDDFKKINDNYGHLVGDEVLQKVAKCFNLSVRKYDFIGRYGGEEFIICLPGVDTRKAQYIAERLRVSIKNITLEKDNIMPHVAASFGISSLGNMITDVHSLTKHADEALYAAKTNGKDQVKTASNCTMAHG